MKLLSQIIMDAATWSNNSVYKRSPQGRHEPMATWDHKHWPIVFDAFWSIILAHSYLNLLVIIWHKHVHFVHFDRKYIYEKKT